LVQAPWIRPRSSSAITELVLFSRGLRDFPPAQMETVACGMDEYAPDGDPQPSHGRKVTGVAEHTFGPGPVQRGPFQAAEPLAQAAGPVPLLAAGMPFPVLMIGQCRRGAQGGIQQLVGR